MDVTPLIRVGQQVIQSYADGRFRVSGKIYEGAILVTPEETVSWEAPASFSELTPEHFGSVNAEVMLLGTGKTMQLIRPDLRAALKEKGLFIEAMDTGAACRTYNVLMAEGRLVAAFLMLA